MPNWRNEYRKCENCRREYRPQRQAQSYCSRDCRRAAAYGRERFNKGTKGRRKRRLEASDKLPATLVAGSFRNGVFSSIETGCYKPTNWIEKLNQHDANEIDWAYWTREKRKGDELCSLAPPEVSALPEGGTVADLDASGDVVFAVGGFVGVSAANRASAYLSWCSPHFVPLVVGKLRLANGVGGGPSSWLRGGSTELQTLSRSRVFSRGGLLVGV